MKKEIIDSRFGSIMIVVPHQDDEILMAAGIIEQAVKAELDVKVVMVTNGDYGCGDYSTGRARLTESITGLKSLGLAEENFILLGYADTGMPAEDSFLTHLYESVNGEKVWQSYCSDKTYGLQEHMEYHYMKYGEHADYTKHNLRMDLRDVILDYRPENIFTTSIEDTHGDHSGLFCFVWDILEELNREGYHPHLYSGIVHSKTGDDFWPRQTDEVTGLECPEGFEKYSSLKWEDRTVFEVPEDMKITDRKKNRKAIALSFHKTALKPDAVDFLYSFVKSEEVFWKLN